jgi:NAD(P)H-hydrate repair Nnr-like enzyme with NAD(P)H-hydrate dehydratase domain
MTVLPLSADLITTWPLPVDEGGDKHVRGTVLIVGGSPVTPGAVVLAGIAALRMGAGRLQIATAAGPAAAVAVAVPEALVMPLPVGRRRLCEWSGRRRRGPRGPRRRSRDRTRDASSRRRAGVRRGGALRCRDDAVVVVDAVAMQAVGALGRDALASLSGRYVLTPNRQELARLAESDRGTQGSHGSEHDERDRDARDGDALLAAVAARLGAVVTSFGQVAAPDGRRWACGEGTPGLGTSGSGDVLAGLIGGAAARSGDAAQAACWGTFVHTETGCRLSSRMGRLGFLARELLEEIPSLWADLERRS